MSRSALIVHFHNETLRNLERTAEALGVSVDDLAEVAIERELAAVGAGIEGRLTRSLERLRSYGPADLDRGIRNFARSGVESRDPFQSLRMTSAEVHGKEALLGNPVE